jgi:hypothetical protein
MRIIFSSADASISNDAVTDVWNIVQDSLRIREGEI